jgi:hypothetical protein
MMDPVTAAVTTWVVSSLSKYLRTSLDDARKEKKTYSDKLENAEGDEIFKYILLMSSAALEEYVAQTRLQAQQSFLSSTGVAMVGFILLSIGIGLAFWASFTGKSDLNAAYLAAVAGLLTEFISGVFFYLYSRTLQQINRFHDRLISSQHVAMSFLAISLLEEQTHKEATQAELAKLLLSQALATGNAQNE